MTRKEAPGARTPGAKDESSDRQGTGLVRVQATEAPRPRTALEAAILRPGSARACPYCGARPEAINRADRRLAARQGINAPAGIYRHRRGCTAAHVGPDAFGPPTRPRRAGGVS
ncbi:hypothetical protein GCM10027054_16670 [Isoptericola nanjingensis]